jgi:hypothetical protein
MERKSYITRRFNQILSETINEKANELMGKLKFNPPGTSFDYVQEGKEMCNECGKPYTIMAEVVEGETCECGDPYSIEVKERLIGGQRKLDKNKNNKIDSGDFRLLRKSKKEMREYTMGDDDIEGVKPYGDMSTDSPNIRPGKNKVKNVGFDYQKKVAKKFDDYEVQEGTIYELEVSENFLKRMFGRKEKEEDTPIETPKSEKNQVGFRYDPSDFDPHTMMHRSDMEAMDNEFRKRKESPQPAENQPREKRSTMSPEAEKMDKDWGALGAVMGVDPREAQRLSDMMKGETNEAEFEKEMEEGNAFTDKLRHTPKGGKFKLGNKEYTDNSSLEEEVLYKLQSGKDSELFTESEIVDMIEQIIMEEKDNIKKGKTPAGLEAYEKAHKGSGKENDDYMKEFTKKITEYTKDGSKEKFTTDAKHFPKGNGELEKMSKKAYVMSDNGKEFLEDYMSPGMEDLVPEEIEYDEDWVKDNIKGSSRTGNNPEWANAVETDLGEKLVKKQKAKKFHKAKETAYRKSKQPVTDGTGENSGSGVNIKLESVDKKTEKLNEEFNRMKSLIGYSQRTQ